VSMFIGHDPRQIEASAHIGAAVVELHTGHYSDLHAIGRLAEAKAELAALRRGAALAHSLGLEVHAGHGLTYDNVAPVAAIPEIIELNIGHFLIGEAIYTGLEAAIDEMRRRMDLARGLPA
jgi:pyridoxine 5-phosphate synthase